MKYNLSELFKRAWKIFRKGNCTFGDALRKSWVTEKASEENKRRIEEAKRAAGVDEETRTWFGWTSVGREVIHEMKSLFKAEVIDGATKNGTRILSFFGMSQTEAIPEV